MQMDRENSQSIAEPKRDSKRERFEGAGPGEGRDRPAFAWTGHGVERATQPYTEKRYAENESERERRTAQERAEHAIPNQLHEKKSKTDQRGGRQDKSRRRSGILFHNDGFHRRGFLDGCGPP